MPSLRNLIDYETRHGYRSFELWEGDITNPGFPVDILVVSSLKDTFTVTPSSVIGALFQNHGIDIEQLSKDPEYDFHRDLGIWISRPLEEYYDNSDRPVPLFFRRILVVEFDIATAENYNDAKDAIENIFASISLFEAKRIPLQTLALPLIGTGEMDLDPNMILSALLPEAKRAVERCAGLERIAFFGYTSETADILDEAMNNMLGRSRVVLDKDPILTGLRNLILSAVATGKHHVPQVHHPLLEEFGSVLRREKIRSFEIGVLGRRFVEMIVADLLLASSSSVTDGEKLKQPSNRNPLVQNIDALKKEGIADWIVGYLHVLRLLGNESAHETRVGERLPLCVEESDLVIALFCIQRLWEFWVEWKNIDKESVEVKVFELASALEQTEMK